MSVFAPVTTKRQVENAVKDTLELWFPTYLAELERQTGRDPGVLPAPRSYSTSNEVDRETAAQLPAVILISTGLAGPPERDGDGVYSAAWRIAVGVVVSAGTRDATNDLVGIYAAAARMIVIDKPSLGGFASGVALQDENYTDAPSDYLDVGSVATVVCDVHVESAFAATGGPATPDLDPPELQQFEEVLITPILTKEPLP